MRNGVKGLCLDPSKLFAIESKLKESTGYSARQQYSLWANRDNTHEQRKLFDNKYALTLKN